MNLLNIFLQKANIIVFYIKQKKYKNELKKIYILILYNNFKRRIIKLFFIT